MESVILEPSLMTVKAIAILDNNGERVLSRYYDDSLPTVKEQKKFEEMLFKKTRDAAGEIVMLEGMTCVYRSNVDLYFYVMGSQAENEIILGSVLNAMYDAFSVLLKRHVERRPLLERLDCGMLILDELVDEGIILEVDPIIIVQRAAVKAEDSTFSEQSVAQALQTAKENFKWSSIFGGSK